MHTPRLTALAIASLLAAAGTTNAAPAQPATPAGDADNNATPAQAPNDRPLVDPAELDIPHNPDTLILRLKENARETNPDDIRALLNAIGTTDHTYRMLPGLMSMQIDDALDVADALQIARVSNLVEYAEPDYLRFPLAAPNDTRYPDMWHLNNTGQSDGFQLGTPGADINAEAAWDIFTGDPNFVIGVIDGGTDPDHPDLQGNFWTNTDEIPNNNIDDDGNGYIDDVHGWDFYDNDNDMSNSAAHGTHVSGTIAAQANNNLGTTGVMWEAQIMALKFIGPFTGSTSDAIAALDYAYAENVRLTNNSWGGGGFNQGLKDAIEQMATIDSLFVAASGNDAASSASFPAAYDSDNIISVDGSDNRDQPYASGNSNPVNVDIAAPAVNVLSSVPSTGYDHFTGTSMASPHVAGVAGLVTAYAPGLRYDQVKQIIMDTARPVAAFTGLSVTGGIVDAEAALLATDLPPSAAFTQLPESFAPGQTTDITITVDNGTQGYDPNSVQLLYTVNAGPQQATAATPIDGTANQFTATLPPFACDDAVLISAAVDSADTGNTTISPDAGPVTRPVGVFITEAEDSFNTDQGWTVSNSAGLTAGAWERGEPVQFNRGNPTADADNSGWAFLTENDPNDDNSDVDNGTTTVTSPAYQVSNGAELSYQYWFNDISGGPASPEDLFTVETSYDNGNTWSTDRSIGVTASRWREDAISITADSASFRVRFTVGDLGDQNVIEAGLDDIRIAGLTCDDPTPACPNDIDGSGTTDLPDLLAVLSNFGQPADPFTNGDTTGDGLVDLNDLLAVLADFGQTCG